MDHDSFRINDSTNILNSSLFEAGNVVNGIVKMEPLDNRSSSKDGSYENNDDDKGHKGTAGLRWTSQWRRWNRQSCQLLMASWWSNPIVKKLIIMMGSFMMFVGLASIKSTTGALVDPNLIKRFLNWVYTHPQIGFLTYIGVYALTVVLLLPGTPLTLGGGYIFTALYGWKAGLTVATMSATVGSALGAMSCFLLGRYLMRERVRAWSRRYPLFDAIDLAISEKGLRIMAMLYLTPILPLGPVSYMCGTTSMSLPAFVLAKVASIPLMSLYVFIGASTGKIVVGHHQQSAEGGATSSLDQGEEEGGVEVHMDGEEQLFLMVLGIVLSITSIACISNYVKKELYEIFEKQKQQQGEKDGRSHDIELATSTSCMEEMSNSNGIAAATTVMGQTKRSKIYRRAPLTGNSLDGCLSSETDAESGIVLGRKDY
eukprot:CAMPEP_0198283700 /NCGR_PEP_ID=MMETSP1449-20131203/3268_1 /TAXON_ID=420275 /ORGANISM="Attheya septentrionalis, Strain CCMP2084" /LENGTH=427 /DNA_ID=CAMNT_0043980433 /DNA_START=417 /DNA_END=1700 /DNA_ORIENTATION=+